MVKSLSRPDRDMIIFFHIAQPNFVLSFCFYHSGLIVNFPLELLILEHESTKTNCFCFLFCFLSQGFPRRAVIHTKASQRHHIKRAEKLTLFPEGRDCRDKLCRVLVLMSCEVLWEDLTVFFLPAQVIIRWQAKTTYRDCTTVNTLMYNRVNGLWKEVKNHCRLSGTNTRLIKCMADMASKIFTCHLI